MFRRGLDYLHREIDWSAIAGSALALLFALAFLVPVFRAYNYGSGYCPQCSPHQWPIPWDWFASSAFWVAVFTLFLTISTYFLWRETRRLAEGADDQSVRLQESIAEMRRSADAAVAAQRPWLIIEVEPISAMTFDDEGPHITVSFNIHNVGQTPATHVQFWGFLIASAKLNQRPIEPALNITQVWAQKMMNLDIGLSVYPGIISKQEQLHSVEKELLVPNWSDRPEIVLIVPVVMSYRFVGGIGYTECVFRISGRTVMPRWVEMIQPAQGPVHANHLACERLYLWDKAS